LKLTLVIAAIAWTALLYGVCRADTAAALDHLCGRPDLATLADAAAHQNHVRPLRLALLMWSEDRRCREDAVNPRTGAVGLTQILPSGSANRAHLTPDELKGPATNLDLGAAHLARWLRICGSFAGALGVYHGRKHCSDGKSDEHVIGILAKWRELRRWLARQAAKVS
jgi:soluble lytic murein transglycosylase-like protein